MVRAPRCRIPGPTLGLSRVGKRFSISTPVACRPWSQFRNWVAAVVETGSTEREKIKAVEQRIGKSIADVSLEVRRDAQGSLTLSLSMDLYTYFAILSDPTVLSFMKLPSAPLIELRQDRRSGLEAGAHHRTYDLPSPFVLQDSPT